MDLSPLRALVRNLNFGAFGVDVILESEAESDQIATRGIWLTPETDDQPGALSLRRRERSYVLAVPIMGIPHGSIVLAPANPAWADLLEPPPTPGEILEWRVDGFAGLESDHTRLKLIHLGSSQPIVPNYTNEIPGGAINGINTVFTLAHIYAPGEINLAKNGLALTPYVDYDETGPREITFPIAPKVGDSLIATRYRGLLS